MFCAVVAHKAATLALQRGVDRSAFSIEKASWRTRLLARRKRNVSDLPYTAPAAFRQAFFVKGIAPAKSL